jgi:hypothetical protein
MMSSRWELSWGRPLATLRETHTVLRVWRSVAWEKSAIRWVALELRESYHGLGQENRPHRVSTPTKPKTHRHQRRTDGRRSRCGIGQGTNARQQSARRCARRGCHRTHRQRPSRGRSKRGSRSSVSGGELRQ